MNQDPNHNHQEIMGSIAFVLMLSILIYLMLAM